MRRSSEIGATLALTAGLLAGCSGKNAPTPEQTAAVTTTPKLLSVVDRAKADYIEAYGCQNDVSITIGNTSEGGSLGGNTLSTANPGLITLDSEDWPTLDSRGQRNTILHEMTHACKPQQPTSLSPFVLADGATVTAAHGLGVLVTLPDGSNTGFRLMEEGAAEALAYRLDRFYTVSSDAYHALGRLTLDLMEQQDIAPLQLANYVQHNDVMGYIAALYDRETATNEQLEATINTFQNA